MIPKARGNFLGKTLSVRKPYHFIILMEDENKGNNRMEQETLTKWVGTFDLLIKVDWFVKQ